MPEISVLMGIYICDEKSKKQAAVAMDSILGQTYADFEFIICDDGSPLAFFQWLQRYCKKDQRIILLRNKKNCGLAAALNRCLEHASGNYLARMDADDISKKNRFEKQVDFLKMHKEYALVGSCVKLIDGHSVWGERKMEEIPRKESFLHTSPFVHPSVMLRREVMEELRGYSEQREVQRVEDYDFFLRLYAAGYSGYNLQEALFAYREDWQAYSKRKYRYRILECIVRYRGFRRLGILKGNLRYVFKPLVVGFVPSFLMRMVRVRRYRIKGERYLKNGFHNRYVL